MVDGAVARPSGSASFRLISRGCVVRLLAACETNSCKAASNFALWAFVIRYWCSFNYQSSIPIPTWNAALEFLDHEREG
jgi:hypothetical protein